MRKKQNELTKKFKGLYLERLAEFLAGLEKEWQWQVHIIAKNEDIINEPVALIQCTTNNICMAVKVEPVAFKHEQFPGYRFLVKKVSDNADSHLVLASAEKFTEFLESERII